MGLAHFVSLLKVTPKCTCTVDNSNLLLLKRKFISEPFSILEINTSLVLVGLNVVSQYADQPCNFSKSLFILVSISMVLVDECEREASSANKRSRSSAISLMYHTKRRGPRTDPCGTPAFIEPCASITDGL